MRPARLRKQTCACSAAAAPLAPTRARSRARRPAAAPVAYTSKTPGKTQQYNYFLLNEARADGQFHLVDMPGLGFAKARRAACHPHTTRAPHAAGLPLRRWTLQLTDTTANGPPLMDTTAAAAEAPPPPPSS
eukprot:3800807-Prymnesium_polylepis.1